MSKGLSILELAALDALRASLDQVQHALQLARLAALESVSIVTTLEPTQAGESVSVELVRA